MSREILRNRLKNTVLFQVWIPRSRRVRVWHLVAECRESILHILTLLARLCSVATLRCAGGPGDTVSRKIQAQTWLFCCLYDRQDVSSHEKVSLECCLSLQIGSFSTSTSNSFTFSTSTVAPLTSLSQITSLLSLDLRSSTQFKVTTVTIESHELSWLAKH